jgi:glucokinase-like ROK family protein
MKKQNVSMILNIIREKAPISRAEIAEISGLTPASITKITQQLIARGIIIEMGTGESGGGRPPMNIKLNRDAFHIIGICFAPKKVDIIISDFESEVIGERSFVVRDPDYNRVADETVSIINAMLKDKKIARKTILGAGIAVNGIVDIEKGVSVFAPFYKWRNIGIRDDFANRLKLPVRVENDTNAMALAERWFGHMKDYKMKREVDDNFVAVNIGDGVGAGIIINDRIYHGCNYAAGEIGHIVVDENGWLCSCGKHGCLETFVSVSAIETETVKLVRSNRSQTRKSVLEDSRGQITMNAICDAARAGDLLSIGVIRKAGEYVGFALANLITSLNPSKIIFGGDIVKAGEIFFDSVQKTIEKETMEILYSPLEICASPLGELRAAKGAIALILNEFYKADNVIL